MKPNTGKYIVYSNHSSSGSFIVYKNRPYTVFNDTTTIKQTNGMMGKKFETIDGLFKDLENVQNI